MEWYKAILKNGISKNRKFEDENQKYKEVMNGMIKECEEAENELRGKCEERVKK